MQEAANRATSTWETTGTGIGTTRATVPFLYPTQDLRRSDFGQREGRVFEPGDAVIAAQWTASRNGSSVVRTHVYAMGQQIRSTPRRRSVRRSRSRSVRAKRVRNLDVLMGSFLA